MQTISISHLTKDYGHGRGVFDISAAVSKGECYGFLGLNGAGKTTTIRHLMGFSKPQSGSASIAGLDCLAKSAEIKNIVGYLPGEIALPTGITGVQFLNMMKKMRRIKSDDYLLALIKRFELDPGGDTKHMSLGVKRKLAVVTAFMNDPEILILDEPTSGLDPVMQQIFIDFILTEKKRGKTIFMSSHIFKEVDAACDRIAIIKDGKIVSEFLSEKLRTESDKIFRITFKNEKDFAAFTSLPFNFSSVNPQKLRARVRIKRVQINSLIAAISKLEVREFQEFPFTLEDYFMQFYKEDEIFEGVKLL